MYLVGSTLIVGYGEGQLRIFDLSRRSQPGKELAHHSRFVLNNWSVEFGF
jgi:hypothetical protein